MIDDSTITAILERIAKLEKQVSDLMPKKSALPAQHPKPEIKSAAWHKIRHLIENTRFAVVDTETADLKGEIVQVAVVGDSGKVVVNSLIKPKGIIAIGAQEVHGITPDMVKDAPSFSEVWEHIRPIFEKITIVSYGSYDQDRFQSDLRTNGIDYDVNDLYWVNAMPIVADYMGIFWREGSGRMKGSFRWEKLVTACELLGVQAPEEHAHTAIGDSYRTLSLIKKIHELGL